MIPELTALERLKQQLKSPDSCLQLKNNTLRCFFFKKTDGGITYIHDAGTVTVFSIAPNLMRYHPPKKKFENWTCEVESTYIDDICLAVMKRM